MLSRLFVGTDQSLQTKAAEQVLFDLKANRNHPDVLWMDLENSLGVKEARLIREHLSFKPHSLSGKVIVIIGAERMTTDAQNSLLKILEEPPANSSIILTTANDNSLLPTILSRCKLTYLEDKLSTKDLSVVDKLISVDLPSRFEIIEKTEDKEDLLQLIIGYFANSLTNNPNQVEFTKLLIEVEKWRKSQGNIRALLEYLMLNLWINLECYNSLNSSDLFDRSSLVC